MLKRRKKIKKKALIITILSLIFFISLVVVFIFIMTPKIKIKGEKSITINVKSDYKESGVIATYFGKDVSKDVKVEGKVDTSKIGTYEIDYVIQKWFFKSEVKRVVTVKDMEKPTIELIGGNQVYVCKNKTYEEQGFKAIDNLDGELTDKVEVINSDNFVTYKVKDKEGNEQTVKRELIYQDMEKPTIELVGGETYTVYQYNSYNDPGVVANDNCDGDIKERVKVTGNVDTSRLGTYEISYEVADSEGNIETIKRIVKVVEKPRGGVIYLTFDDGPNSGTTDNILNVLKEEGVKATFFVTCNGPDYLIEREASEGHTVALHTATHDYARVYSSVENYFRDLQTVHDRVQRITGQDARIIRFPGGSSNTVSRSYQVGIMSTLTKEVLNRGYRYFDWNVDSNDAGGANTSAAVYQNVVNHLSRSSPNVVLMHDIKYQTSGAIRDIIRYGKDNGFTFAAITENTTMVRHGVNN